MPCLQERPLVLLHYGLYPTKFDYAKPEITSQRNRVQPEFRGSLVSVDVYMRRLIGLVAAEIESIGPRF
jgi:hypothetical protein